MITTAVGSYPKPPAQPGSPNLRQAHSRFDSGQMTRDELHGVQDEVTKEVIHEQIEAGLDLVTDGQIRWDDGQTYLAQHIAGFSIDGLLRYFDTNTYYRQPIVQGKLAWRNPILLRDYQHADALSSRPVKAIVTGPYTLAKLSQNQHYPDLRSLVLDLAEALNQEALALQKAGASTIQFDEPAILRYKEDFPLLQEAAPILVKGINVKTALYTWFRDISGLYPQLLKLPFQVIGLDFVMGQGNFKLLRDFPSDKELGFGIADARNTKLETVEELVKALKRISKVVPLEQIHLNPSCGLEYLPRPTAYLKLKRLVEAAGKAQEVLA